MSRSDEQRIEDILEYAEKIASAVAKGHEVFLNDEFVGPAIERFIEILGEASRQLSDEAKQKYPQVNWAEIIGMRTRLAHTYHRINPENIWGAATIDVPALVKALKQTS